MLEQEKRWGLIQQGRAQDYHGVAVHPRHLSLFERVVLKRHLQYRAEGDGQAAAPVGPLQPHSSGAVHEPNEAIPVSCVSHVLSGAMQSVCLDLSGSGCQRPTMQLE